MLVLTVVAAVLWALRYVPSVGLPVDVTDFFGGAAVGLGIGAAVVWAGERTPSN